jgi:TPR repeat protein
MSFGNDLSSRETPRRTIVLVSAAIVLAGAAGWFLHQAAGVFDKQPRAVVTHEIADAREALRQEREKSQRLERQLAGALQRAGANPVATADTTGPLQQAVTDLGKALREERARSASLSRDLDAARRENEAQTSTLENTSDPSDTSRQLADAQQALQQERTRADGLALYVTFLRREYLTVLHKENEAQPVALEKAAEVQIASVAPQAAAPATTPPASTLPAADPETRRLMGRARQLIEQRNIIAARSMLERAADSGHPTALFALAETYDPNQLAAWGTVGTQGDPAQARELYQKALAGGMTDAQARLTALQR